MVLPKLEGWLLLQQLQSVQVQHEDAKKGCLRISAKKQGMLWIPGELWEDFLIRNTSFRGWRGKREKVRLL